MNTSPNGIVRNLAMGTVLALLSTIVGLIALPLPANAQSDEVFTWDEIVEEYCPAAAAFTDIPDYVYYAEPVAWAACDGITTGTTTTTFSPNAFVTRAQMATFLYRLAGEPDVSREPQPFADVPDGSYFSNPVKWLKAEGITTGTDASTFDPHKVVNRAQMATFLYRTAGEPEVTATTPFGDVPAGTYFTNPVAWMTNTGITNGTGDGSTFSPAANLTRGQAVTFLLRFWRSGEACNQISPLPSCGDVGGPSAPIELNPNNPFNPFN